ncbi:MAG: hypothetical protein AAGB14_04575 [Verrucomicrobiota bacterium]
MRDIRHILLIHHTHTDLGYTHTQPVVWRLHRSIIDSAIALCEASRDYDRPSRMRWTCEVTMTLEDWLKRAPADEVERFRKLVSNGQMGAGALPFNITPMLESWEVGHALESIPRLRAALGLPFRMAINHDVNGMPWPIVGMLLDAGVETLMMGINPHFGGAPLHRPLVFDWEGPDGRRIRTMNAEHYRSFHRWMKPESRSLDVMSEGLERYLANLEDRLPDYPHDFILMSATHFDFIDNNPADELVLEMVRRWNDEGRQPMIEFVTSDQLADELLSLPQNEVGHARGDWPDYWNFGCASTAREVRISRNTKSRLGTLDRIGGALAADEEDRRRAWFNTLVFDEHTWGSWATSWNHGSDDVPSGLVLKQAVAHEARSLTSWVLRRALDHRAGNAAATPDAPLRGLAVCNPAPLARSVMLRVPTRLALSNWHHYPSRLHSLDVRAAMLEEDEERLIGPVNVPAGETVMVSKDDFIAPAPTAEGARVDADRIESPFYRLQFDPASGKGLSLVDLETGAELIDPASSWDFAGFVRESVDPQRHQGKAKYHGRDALFDTDFEKLSERMQSGWKKDWPALRETAGDDVIVTIELHPLGARLERHWKRAPGVRDLRISLTLPVDRKAIVIETSFLKDDAMEPEGVYFTFPLAMTGWKAWYDSMDVAMELDHDQLPGAVRDYQTVGTFAAVAGSGHQVTLACPDAPMVQFGGFHFGKSQSSIPREAPCLLLAWPMNTYWDTNFPASQPGFQCFRYEITSAGSFDPKAALDFGRTAITPIEIQPVLEGADFPDNLLKS